MKVVYFGTFSLGDGYPRNRVLIEALRRNGVEVETIRESLFESSDAKIAGMTRRREGLRLLGRAAIAWTRLARRYLSSGPHDVVVVGYTGQVDVFLAKLLCSLTGKKVVLDAFLSLYDTVVKDRRLVGEGSFLAAVLKWLDIASSRAADLVLLDTEAHVRFFTRLTRLPPSHFARIFVGEDDRLFPADPPAPRQPREPLRVLWFGTWVPLQGAEIVLRAAAELKGEPIRIRMVGTGQQLPALRARAEALSKVELVPHFVTHEELNREIRAAHVCLGVFGTSRKARRVIPCKVYDALAVGRAVVTADTSAVRELLTPDRDALLVPPGDAGGVARALLRLAADDKYRLDLSRQGHARYSTAASPDALGEVLGSCLQNLTAQVHRGSHSPFGPGAARGRGA